MHGWFYFGKKWYVNLAVDRYDGACFPEGSAFFGWVGGGGGTWYASHDYVGEI